MPHSILYSKRFGLEHLHKHLAGVPGVSVLPYRVYHGAGELDRSHFPSDTQRFLVRLDFHVDEKQPHACVKELMRGMWDNLPRHAAKQEPTSFEELQHRLGEAVQRARHIKGHYKQYLIGAPEFTTSVIVRPTVPRKEIHSFGCLNFYMQNARWMCTVAYYPDAGKVAHVDRWRNPIADIFQHKKTPTVPASKAAAPGMENVPHDIAGPLSTAIRELASSMRDIRCNGVRPTNFQAWFSVPKHTMQPEFYDLLVTKLADPPKNRANEPAFKRTP